MTIVRDPGVPRRQTSPNDVRPMECIRRDLHEVEEILHRTCRSDVPVVQEACRHVQQSGGKRLRPALVLLSCRALGSESTESRWTAAAVEMIHTATLLHDDVVDGARSRRGRETANAIWGAGAAVLAGNLLLARAFGLLVQRGQVECLRFLSRSMMTMCEGELLQNMHQGNFDLSEEIYYQVIRAKTADFLSACCRAGAMLAGGNPESVERLADYGMNLGLAFQVIDDLLDVCGDEEETGKPLGGDLRERKLTLPLILGLRNANPAERERILTIARKPSIESNDIDEIRGFLTENDAPAQTRQVSESFTRASLSRIEALPSTPSRFALEAIARSLSSRSK